MFAYVYARRDDVGTGRWVRRFDARQCDAASEAHCHVMMLRQRGYPLACWAER